jgi:hypothetical protein
MKTGLNRYGQMEYLPEVADIEGMKVGDNAPYCFGVSQVTEITYTGTDVFGQPYIGYYVRFGENGGTMSAGMTAGQPVITPYPGTAVEHYADILAVFGLRYRYCRKGEHRAWLYVPSDLPKGITLIY